jgi:flagellar hook-basal body complex protein FliE
MSDLAISATRAYAQAASALTGKEPSETSPVSGPSFQSLIGSGISSLQSAGSQAEGAIVNAAMGKGDLVDVVTAVAAAEATLETVMAVRDEVVKAYQDIMRMPI